MPNIVSFQRLKCNVFPLLSVFAIVNEISLRFGTRVGQKKEFEGLEENVMSFFNFFFFSHVDV